MGSRRFVMYLLPNDEYDNEIFEIIEALPNVINSQ